MCIVKINITIMKYYYCIFLVWLIHVNAQDTIDEHVVGLINDMCHGSDDVQLMRNITRFEKECAYDSHQIDRLFRSCSKTNLSDCDTYFACSSLGDTCVVNFDTYNTFIYDRLRVIENAITRLVFSVMEWASYVLVVLGLLLYEHRHDAKSSDMYSGVFFVIAPTMINVLRLMNLPPFSLL